MKHFLPVFFLALLFSAVWAEVRAQGSTTSQLTGFVKDATGEPLPGATVVAVHTPSGTQYGNVTNIDGFYRLPNMRVGGPYMVKVTFVGYNPFTQEGIQLKLGQPMALDVTLQEEVTELQEIVITATQGSVIDGNRTGAETVISEETINSLPTVSRAIGDFARLNPQANLQEGTDGYSISIGGMNNRYNAIYIDGAVNNDVFGLAGSGTNGGQTGVSPISIDAIEQFNIAVAPFDVRQSGFAGGSINAVTRSGTNEFQGSAYYFFRNENLAGKTPTDDEGEDRERLAEFTAKTFGVRVGGPIVKDKVFFFVNAELQRDETPQPFNFNDYRGASTLADLQQLEDKLQGYGYNPGPFNNNTAFLNSDKLLLRLDFNISNNHKLMLRHSYTKAENLEAVRSTAFGIRYLNSSEFFLSNTHSSSLELNSTFGNNMANSLVIGYTSVRDDRDPFGGDFPNVSIDDGDGEISFGSEPFSTANQLDQDILTITNNLEIFKGKHTITLGTHNEFYDVYNLFIRQNYGAYEFNDLDEFLNDQPSRQYDRSYSLIDDVTGDGSAAASIFDGLQLGFYVQDEYQVNTNLKITGGLRVDIPIFTEDTPENPEFNRDTRPLIEEAGYDLQGAQTGAFVDPQLMFAPRLGFNWDVTGDANTQVRGGIGIFNSRIPLVWPGGAFNNNGALVGGDRKFDEVVFIPAFDEQPRDVPPNSGLRSGQIDLFAEDFKFPQVWKGNLAVDHRLPGDIIGTVEFLYTGFLNNIYYQNLNLKPATERATGTPDDRLLYNRRDEIDDTYTGIYLASNTSKGYSYTITGQLQKNFASGLMLNTSYSYGDAWSIFDGTSSQNSSQWRGLNTVNGRNNFEELGRSDFSQGHRIVGAISYRKEYGGFAATQLSLFYNGQSGRPFSYIINEFAGNRSSFTNEDSRQRSLIYVPAAPGEIIFGEATDQNVAVPYDASQQAALYAELDAYIAQDDYLSERRGQYTERNMNRTPFESILDLRILQDFFVELANGKRNTLQLSFDIFNFGNLLNKDWGRRYFVPFGNYEIYQFQGFIENTRTPVYQLNLPDNDDPWDGNIDDSGISSSRWQAQIGVRYIFGN